jgi:hypothetical protein
MGIERVFSEASSTIMAERPETLCLHDPQPSVRSKDTRQSPLTGFAFENG